MEDIFISQAFTLLCIDILILAGSSSGTEVDLRHP